ncbi:MAG: preprotein translocase subunit SecY [Chloroflexota bacterium]
MGMTQTFQNMRNALRVGTIRDKLLFTLLILVIYQFVAHVPVIGVERTAMQALLTGEGAGLLQVLNLLSGGAVANFSVIANGVYPYITASIIFQLLIPVIPQLEQIQREPGGQEKIQRWTYYASIPMAIMQSIAQINIFNILATSGGAQVQIIPGFGSDPLLTATVIITMTAGCMFAIWLGELITEEGIGNGISIIIFAGIVAIAPQQLVSLFVNSGDRVFLFYNVIMFVVLTVGSVIAIILIQEGVRRIPVQYGKKVRGRKQYGGATTYIPLKVNPVGMIPLIFAQSVMAFPAILASLLPDSEFTRNLTLQFGNQQGFVYWFTFFLFTVGFTFFYADVMTQNQNLAENLQKQNGFIPGIRPGKRTNDYIQRVTRRITMVGAVFLGIIAVIPGFVGALNNLLFQTGTSLQTNAAFVIGGAGLIIVVGVVIDTLRQIEAQLVMRNYEGFMR